MIDQTAPEAGVTANTNGSVDITLPTNPVAGDAVKVTYTPTGGTETTATLTYNGSNWTGIPDGFTLGNGTVTIPADKVADNTTVKAVGSDLAGNTQSPAASGTTATDPVSGVTVKDLTENGVVLNGSNGTNNTIDFVKAADLGGVVSVKGPAGTTSTVTFTSANGQVIKTVSNDGTEKALNLTPEEVKTLTGGDSQAISVNVATGDLGEQNYSNVFTINPTSEAFELIPSINNISSNDDVHPGVDAVLNGTELELITVSSNTGPSSGISFNYTIIAPSTAQIGDTITLYNAGREIPYLLDTQAKVDTWKSGRTGLAYSVTLDSSTLSTGQEVTLKAIYTTKDGESQTLEHKYWYDGKAPTVGVETTDTTATVTLPTESDAASVTVKVGDDTVTLVKDGSNWTPQAGSTITPTIASGQAVFTGLTTGTTVTATATDTVGNTSAEVSKVTQAVPMSISAVSVTDENSTTDGVQVVDNDVNFSYTLAGNIDADKEIRVRVVDANGTPVDGIEPQYFTPTAGTKTGSIAVPAINGQNLKVVADIVSKADHAAAVGGSAKEAAFNLDNVHTVDAELVDNNTVKVDGITYDFGTPQDDKTKLSPDGSKVIYNPQLDWLMNFWDDYDRYNNSGDLHRDHAPNVTNIPSATNDPGVAYNWVGDENKGDVIIAERRWTEDSQTANEYRFQGVIGVKNDDNNYNHSFRLDTQGGGADYIRAEGGITGSTSIKTNDGNDVISTTYLNAKHIWGTMNFNGTSTDPQQILMGEGNDQLLVTGKAADVGITNSSGNTNDANAAFYNTNTKVDLGSGNDIMKVTGGHILADAETQSGNYFMLGAGDDVMETKTITSVKDKELASNIINLGSGYDRLTVNGHIMGEQNGYYNAQNVRDYEDWQARFLLMSQDSSDVHITGNVGGKVSMLMGSGNDNIRIDQELWVSDKSNVMDWLSIALNRANIAGGNWNSFYVNERGEDLRNDINAALSSGVTNSGASGLGATSVTKQLDGSLQGDINIADIFARIDLGNGDNTFTVGGGVTNANILGGTGTDTIKLGFNSDGSLSNGVWVYGTKVWTGNDTSNDSDLVMMNNVTGATKVYTGGGSDDIQLNGVNNTGNEVHAGVGNDTIALYGKVQSDNTNIIDGGAGYDKVIIGNNGDDRMDYFVVGGQDSGHTQIWSMEEILFNSVNSGDQVKVYAAKLNDEHTLYIKGMTDNPNVNTLAGQNKVQLAGSWNDQGNTTVDGVAYHHYTATVDGTTENLYIQNGISII